LEEQAFHNTIIIVDMENTGGDYANLRQHADSWTIERKVFVPKSMRGLKKRTKAPVVANIESTSVPFARLQRAHDKARLERSVIPPCFRLMT
jgi:hypothetical protein